MNREDYVAGLKKGDLIAFKTSSLEAKMYSGKVTKIGRSKVEVETKNGKKYFINKENICWVNMGGKWPSHIMQALKGIDVIEENENEQEENVSYEEVLEEANNSSIVVEDASTGIIVDVVEQQETVEE